MTKSVKLAKAAKDSGAFAIAFKIAKSAKAAKAKQDKVTGAVIQNIDSKKQCKSNVKAITDHEAVEAAKFAAVTADQEIQVKIDRAAEEARAGGLPDEQNRWLKMTVSEYRKNEKARAKIVEADKKPSERKIAKSGKKSSITAGHSLNLDETGKAILKEQTTAKAQKKEARLRELREAKVSSKVRPTEPKDRREPSAKPKTDKKPPAGPKPVLVSAKESSKKVASPGRKGAFSSDVVEKLMPLVKKGTTFGEVIKAARWGSCANPERRVVRFIVNVLKHDMRLKVVTDGEGETTTLKIAS